MTHRKLNLVLETDLIAYSFSPSACFGTWQRRFGIIEEHLLPDVYTTETAIAILTEYLDPASKTRAKEAALRLRHMLGRAIGWHSHAEFGGLVWSVAGQIPYDHPSQARLVELLLLLPTKADQVC